MKPGTGDVLAGTSIAAIGSSATGGFVGCPGPSTLLEPSLEPCYYYDYYNDYFYYNYDYYYYDYYYYYYSSPVSSVHRPTQLGQNP